MKPFQLQHSILKLPATQSRPSIVPRSLRTNTLYQIPKPAALHVSPPITSLPFSIEQGLAPFLSSQSLTSLAVDWQDGLLDRLNQHVQGTSAENKSLFDTIVDLAKDRTQVIPFNLASEALNNSFFLSGLKKAHASNLANRPSEGSLLATAIEETYGSITQFISYFSNAAMGMSSSGYIWLVCDQDGSLGICATYGAGTILVQNREQRGDWTRVIKSSQIGLDSSGRPITHQQKTESNQTPKHDSSNHQSFRSNSQDQNPDGISNPNNRMFSTSDSSQGVNMDPKTDSSTMLKQSTEERAVKPRSAVSFADSLFASPTPSPNQRNPATLIPNRAITRKNTNPSERFNHLHPLMNLVVAERAYLLDYGVWGKDSYLKNFWKCVDWFKIEQAFIEFAPKPSSHQPYSSIWKT